MKANVDHEQCNLDCSKALFTQFELFRALYISHNLFVKLKRNITFKLYTMGAFAAIIQLNYVEIQELFR